MTSIPTTPKLPGTDLGSASPETGNVWPFVPLAGWEKVLRAPISPLPRRVVEKSSALPADRPAAVLRPAFRKVCL